MNKKISQLETKVMSTIKSGKVKMKPHWYFILTGAFGSVLATIIGFAAIYATSVASLWLRVAAISGQAIGLKNKINDLVASFPWWTILIAILSLIVIVYMIKKFGHLYKIRPIQLVIITIISIVAIGFATSYTSLPNILMKTSTNTCSTNDINCLINNGMYRKLRQMK